MCRWYVYDGLGSVVGEVDPAGNLTSSPQYDVYGAVRANLGTASSRQGFVGGLGHVSDAETGLVYMRARYYDPNTGRFMSEDPAGQGVNWYVYCMNNPINYVDASGRIATDLVMDIFLALGGVEGISIASFETWQGLSNQAATNILGRVVAGLRTGAEADVATAAECDAEAERYQARQNDNAAAGWKLEAKSSLAQSALKSAAIDSIRIVRQILESEI